MSESERYAIVKQIQLFIAKGWSKATVKHEIARITGYSSPKAILNIYNEACKELADEINPESLKATIIERLDNISEEAQGNMKYSDAIKALDTMAKISGIVDNKKEVNVSGDIIKIQFGE